jgi:MoaA/NifB/PqqE/SkfB family radical SAM enzyme
MAERMMGRPTTITGRRLIACGAVVLFAWVARVLLASPIPQAPAYHHFADARALWGLRNFGNVVSNAPFALVGLLALGTLASWARRPAPGVQTRFELVAFAVFFVGVLLTAFGSGYYHLEPSNGRLFWDRLPMTIGFMSLLAITIGERIDRRAGAWLLAPLLLTGIASVVLWERSEQAGHGDLRFYLLVQFAPLVAIPLMLWLFPPRYTRTVDLLISLGFYALAKVLEVADGTVYEAGHIVSGHTLKHVSAALATFWLFRMLSLRQPLAGHAAGARCVRGVHKATVIARIFARVAWLALRTRRRPLRAACALRRLCAAVQNEQWATPTPRRGRLWTSQKLVFSSGRYFLDFYAPGWPSVAFDRAVERELERVDPLGRPPGLNTTILAITRRCGLNCEHCFEWEVLNHREALSADELQEIVRRLQRVGSAQIVFSGGEPLARFADLVMLAALASAESDVWVQSSGLGLTSEKAIRLRAAGVTGVSLSLDHWNPSAHDRFRGLPGSFAAVEIAARHAREAGLLVAFSLCPTRAFVTAANLERYAEIAHSLGASFIQLLEPKAVGHYAGRDVALSAAQQRILEEFCERLDTDAAARDMPTVEYADWGARTLGCRGAGDRYGYIDTAGELHPCPFCHGPGIGVLDHDIDSAISILQHRGCPAAANERPNMRSSA